MSGRQPGLILRGDVIVGVSPQGDGEQRLAVEIVGNDQGLIVFEIGGGTLHGRLVRRHISQILLFPGKGPASVTVRRDFLKGRPHHHREGFVPDGKAFQRFGVVLERSFVLDPHHDLGGLVIEIDPRMETVGIRDSGRSGIEEIALQHPGALVGVLVAGDGPF